MRKKILTLFAILFIGSGISTAQTYVELSLNQFLERVRISNLEYAAEALEIEQAEAEIITASLYNNPNFEFSYFNDELFNMQMGEGYRGEISQTISPGRRRAALNVAKGEKEVAQVLLIDYYRVLREEASLLWLECVKNRQLYQIMRESYLDQVQLMTTDSLTRGSEFLSDLDILQNRVETGLLYTQLLDMENELSALYHSLTTLCGCSISDTILIPERKNIWNDREFNLSEITQTALNNRADILALKKGVDLAKLAIKAAKIERIPEFDLFFSYCLTEEARNEMAPSPRFRGLEVGISIPIPLFNRNQGEIMGAESKKREAELRLQQSELEIKSEVSTAYNHFLITDKKLSLFRMSGGGGLVKNARELLDKKREEYFKGEIHLIEVLDAQRSYDEILSSFYSSIFNKSQALVKLESAIGIWDIKTVK